MMVALLACVHSAFVTFSPILSSKQLALAIQKHYRPGDVVVIDGQYHQASSLNFYLPTPVRVLHEPSGNLWYGSKFPDAPRVFETPPCGLISIVRVEVERIGSKSRLGKTSYRVCLRRLFLTCSLGVRPIRRRFSSIRCCVSREAKAMLPQFEAASVRRR